MNWIPKELLISGTISWEPLTSTESVADKALGGTTNFQFTPNSLTMSWLIIIQVLFLALQIRKTFDSFLFRFLTLSLKKKSDN